MPTTKPDTGMAHTADQSEMARALAEAKANEIYSSQLMRRFRDTLMNVRDGLEDEGDRIYFGSTNDADQLRDIIEEVEELEWDRILASSQKKPDLYARIRELNTEVRAVRALQKELLAALRKADQFISNGTELGYIRMPDADTPDSAHDTPPMIRAAIAKATGAA
jgi:hypothetical protein